MTASSENSRISFGLALGMALWLLPAAVLAHKDDYLGVTFVFVTLDARELELEYWLDAQVDPAVSSTLSESSTA